LSALQKEKMEEKTRKHLCRACDYDAEKTLRRAPKRRITNLKSKIQAHADGRGRATDDFDPGMEYFNFMDEGLDSFDLESGISDQRSGLLDLHFQLVQFGCVASFCHSITIAVAVPDVSLAAS
jgi:hypothetical protein